MPPKRKQSSSAHSARQAKNRKRNQRQREQQCFGSLSTSKSMSFDDRRRERDAVAHRLVRLNRPRRLQEHYT